LVETERTLEAREGSTLRDDIETASCCRDASVLILEVLDFLDTESKRENVNLEEREVDENTLEVSASLKSVVVEPEGLWPRRKVEVLERRKRDATPPPRLEDMEFLEVERIEAGRSTRKWEERRLGFMDVDPDAANLLV
jgi:hypothetical protein